MMAGIGGVDLGLPMICAKRRKPFSGICMVFLQVRPLEVDAVCGGVLESQDVREIGELGDEIGDTPGHAR